jgi:hypothetical protein
MYRRWVSAYQFKWTPILTYTRRHLELLSWLEKNTEPVSFTETDMRRFGVALVAKDLRVTVDARGMNIQSGLSGVPTERLLPAIEGILTVMEPRDTVLTNATVAGSYQLEDADYHEECARFAIRTSALSKPAGAFRPLDASVIADLESSDWKVQVEWGIVNKKELFTRLSDPSKGRLQRQQLPGGGRQPARHDLATFADELPSVSVFTDMYLARRHGGEVGELGDVERVIGVTNAQAELISNGLAEQYLVDTREVDRELNTGA